MSCMSVQRCKDVAQCGTYRLYINSSTSAAYSILFENTAGRQNWLQKTSVTATVNSLNLSYVEFTSTEMGGFLETYGDVEIWVLSNSATSLQTPTQLYLYEIDGTAVYSDSVIVKFKPDYSGTSRALPTNLATQIFKAC